MISLNYLAQIVFAAYGDIDLCSNLPLIVLFILKLVEEFSVYVSQGKYSLGPPFYLLILLFIFEWQRIRCGVLLFEKK